MYLSLSLSLKKSVKRKLSPGRHPAECQAQTSTTEWYISDTLYENSKKTSISGELLHENSRIVFFKKNALTLDVSLVTKGRRRRLKVNFCFKISSFKISESFKSVTN